MNSIKCKNCGLSNFSVETECRRCGQSFIQAPKKKVGRRPRRFSIWSLLMIAAILSVVYYFYNGVQDSMAEIDASEAKRVASQPAPQQPAGLSRSEQDRQRAGSYGNAVKNSQSLNAHQQHINQTEKAMQQVSNSR